jgi:hypothetical protein
MVSSQCKRAFPKGGRTLTAIRQDIRDKLEGATLFDAPLFEVWINEDAPAAGLEQNSWEKCLTSVRQADILIVLDAGHAGWARSSGDVGICHAELMTAFNAAPAKVRIIPIRGSEALDDEDSARNQRFEQYVGQINAFSPPVYTESDLMKAVENAVVDAVSSLTELGVREARKGRFHSGDALEWSKLNFAEREERMVATLQAALAEARGVSLRDGVVTMPLASGKIAFHLHASPGALSVTASRERVGRPFLEDHRHVDGYRSDTAGPVHLVACQSGATEAQARTILGFPDTTVISAPFGVFVADQTQQIQFALLKDCRDETTTRSAAHRFFDWLRETGEEAAVLDRAQKRRRVVNAIAAEL